MQVPEIKTRSTLRLRVLAAVGSLLIVMSLGAPATALATGGATHLVVTGLTNAAAGTAQTATVTAKDGTEATDATYVGTVTLTSTDGAAVLESAKALVAGVGTFTVTLKTAGSQTVTANGTSSITGLQTVTVTAGTATKLAFGVQPTSTASGASISPSITVLAQDAFGNTDTTSAASVTLAIGSNPGAGT